MDVHVLDHPLAAARLTTMRDVRTGSAGFRAALRELTTMLIYEASRDAPVETVSVQTPVATAAGFACHGHRCWSRSCGRDWAWWSRRTHSSREARMGFVGMARDEATHLPVTYLQSLPPDLSATPVFVLDPMLATGGSMVHTVELLAARGARDVTSTCALAAPEGIARLAASGLPVRLVTASVDARRNEDAFIVPGFGDAGDRQFGPR